jgi:glyoxylase-like metal-dependent hydrolase (beta-lactamase superfamily II)
VSDGPVRATPAGWVLVDTGTRAEAIPIRNELHRLAPRPVVAVFNTHFHDDHAGGNAVYRGMGVPIHASRATVRLEGEIRSRMVSGAPREIARLDSCADAAPAGPDRDRVVAFYDFLARWWREGALDAARDPQFVVPADRPFDDRLRLVIGGLVIEARTFARNAHSAGDAVIALPTRHVAAIGDIAIKGGAPWADQFMGDGSLEGVVAAQDTLLAWLGGGFGGPAVSDTTWRLVPGHGSTLRIDEFRADHAALRQLRVCAALSHDAGQPRAVAAADCAGVGFPGSTAAYAVWLFFDEWHGIVEPAASRALTKP